MKKAYIGDSVYVELNRFGQIVLTTENGGPPSNTIYLEPEVYQSLIDFVAHLRHEVEVKEEPERAES